MGDKKKKLLRKPKNIFKNFKTNPKQRPVFRRKNRQLTLEKAKKKSQNMQGFLAVKAYRTR